MAKQTPWSETWAGGQVVGLFMDIGWGYKPAEGLMHIELGTFELEQSPGGASRGFRGHWHVGDSWHHGLQ